MRGSQETSRPWVKSGEEPEGINPSANVECLPYSIKPRTGLVVSVSFGDRRILGAGLSFTSRMFSISAPCLPTKCSSAPPLLLLQTKYLCSLRTPHVEALTTNETVFGGEAFER